MNMKYTKCPACNAALMCVDSRPLSAGKNRVRVYRCPICKKNTYTMETVISESEGRLKLGLAYKERELGKIH